MFWLAPKVPLHPIPSHGEPRHPASTPGTTHAPIQYFSPFFSQFLAKCFKRVVFFFFQKEYWVFFLISSFKRAGVYCRFHPRIRLEAGTTAGHNLARPRAPNTKVLLSVALGSAANHGDNYRVQHLPFRPQSKWAHFQQCDILCF